VSEIGSKRYRSHWLYGRGRVRWMRYVDPSYSIFPGNGMGGKGAVQKFWRRSLLGIRPGLGFSFFQQIADFGEQQFFAGGFGSRGRGFGLLLLQVVEQFDH
jgi:hypothetical protein